MASFSVKGGTAVVSLPIDLTAGRAAVKSTGSGTTVAQAEVDASFVAYRFGSSVPIDAK
jgi:hypothetical protein